MATIYGSILGVRWEDDDNTQDATATISFTMPAYTASSDNGSLGGGGYDRGRATTSTLAVILQNTRRDSKAVTFSQITTAVAILFRRGLQGSTSFYLKSPAISSANLTFDLSNITGTEIDAANGVVDRPMVIAVRCELA